MPATSVTLIDPSNNVDLAGHAPRPTRSASSRCRSSSRSSRLWAITRSMQRASNGNDINGSLRVAEFKPPNFKLDLPLSATARAGGFERSRRRRPAPYLFGAPLQGGIAHAVRHARRAQPSSRKDGTISRFGPQWFWPDQTPSFDTDVLQQRLHARRAKVRPRFPVPVPTDLPFPMTYTVDVETTDVSNLSVSDSKAFMALPSDAMIGLYSDVVGPAGSPMPIKAIVTDAAGKALAGRARPSRTAEDDLYVGDARSRRRRERAASRQVRHGRDRRRDLGRSAGQREPHADAMPARTACARTLAARRRRRPPTTSKSLPTAGRSRLGQTRSQQPPRSSSTRKRTRSATRRRRWSRRRSRVPTSTSSVVRNDALYRTTLHDVSGAAQFTFKSRRTCCPTPPSRRSSCAAGAPSARQTGFARLACARRHGRL